MTSRTPMGVQPRPPQRALSSSSLPSAQRPPPQQRALSHHYPPARKDGTDAVGEGSDASQSRHGGANTPRKGGSRLRLEITNDEALDGQMAVQSPSSFSSRMLPVADGTDGANSPALSRASQHELENPPPPMPMPKRRPPRQSSVNLPIRDVAPPAAPAKKDGRPKPYTVEIPAAAPRLLHTSRQEAVQGDFFGKGLFSGHADFFPWTGKHLEDSWSTESITKGIWERPSADSGSARLSIVPVLKQKTGLSALSTIFMGVLNQKRHKGQVTAPSTFKPPPRVTLTDTKREFWLKDLANPAISLRRLSRTIPHGIRGRTLLDQCLNKNVPIERAVWLAKCVGANEIRAFKRKGANGAFVMGGEAKWSRDWTVFVEQFVEGAVFAVNEENWRAKVKYAVQLATSLYVEHLLDRDHYLDWVIVGLESSPQSKLPMWILVANIYWKDILRLRKFGRRLVTALMRHIHAIHTDPDRDILIRLSSQLASLLSTLIKDSPENFISPNPWLQYRDALRLNLPADDEACKRAYAAAQVRNHRLQVLSTASAPAGRQHIVRLLDSILQAPPDEIFASKCWDSIEDSAEVARTLVTWATSAHRPGLAKVYLATNLLKTWSRQYGFDATEVVLEVVQSVSDCDNVRKSLVYHLVTELVRSDDFSVSRYILWLIARGGYNASSELDAQDASCGSRLLLELPLHGRSSEWKTTRANLLRRVGFSAEEEAADISNAIKCVQHILGLALPDGDEIANRKPMSTKKLIKLMKKSSRALQSSIGAYLGDLVASHQSAISTEPLSLPMFNVIRLILESIEDFVVLSGVVGVCLKTADVDMLASCADTVNLNIHIFYAIGSACTLFNSLLERLKSLSRQDGVVPRPFLAGMLSLAARMHGKEQVTVQLRQELLEKDRSNAIDACSPVSDSMLAQTQGSDSEISEEIDRLLGSGNSIDNPTMNRLFRTIVPKLEQAWAKGNENRRVFAMLLAKTRVFDTNHFDKLMPDWISHVRTLKSRAPLADLLPLLLCTGCLPVSTVLQTANASPPVTVSATELDLPKSATYLQELLQLLLVKLPKSDSLTMEEVYKFGIHQQTAVWDNPNALLSLIRNAILEYSGLRKDTNRGDLPLDDIDFQAHVLDALRLLVVLDSSAVSEALSIKSLPAEASEMIHKMTSKLLQPDVEHVRQLSFDEILGLANELTLPFCQLKLNMDLSIIQPNQTESEDGIASRLELFANAMDRAIEANNFMWTSMLPCLSADVSQHLKNIAYHRFISLVPSLKSSDPGDTAPSNNIHLAHNLLEVIEAITSGQPLPKTAQLSNALVDKLSDLSEIIVSKDAERVGLQELVLKDWLPALLRLVVLYSVSSETIVPVAVASTNAAAVKPPSLANHEVRARIILVLCSLLLELEYLPSPQASRNQTLPQYVFDVATLLADGLPDDLRAQCAKTILLLPGAAASVSLSSDPRLFYLFSTLPSTTEDNLVLALRDKAAVLQNAGPRGMSAMYGIGPSVQEKLSPFVLRRWELLSEPTPIVGENDTALSLSLFEAIKIQ